ncbi:MAG: serine--tRNA ligase [Chlamydiae bacterium CG10_big_fil_rev_8_21_14_0_10_42_34]|nr:MAG: serine--tRNA ligase [Chlamydiae bacterium CG10_big_fil_rev_8_21_14_0_10_42_34]
MLDIKEIRKDPIGLEAKLKNKVPEVTLTPIVELDEKIRSLKTEVEEFKSQKNQISKEIGIKKQKGEDIAKILSEMGSFGDKISKGDQEISQLEETLNNALAILPNTPMDDVPVSPRAEDNVCIKEWGKKPTFSFPFKNHVELNEKLKLFDFVRGAKISGSGWPLYVGFGARLEWALLNYMLDIHRKNGFSQVMTPILVRPETMYGSGQLPKFEQQLFKIKDDDYNLYLIPTAEVPLNGMHLDEILDEEQLPIKMTSYTTCFRREAGAAGSQERGLIRTHQFNKVEMFCLTKPEDSERVYEEMLKSAEEILQGLNIHYRNMLLTTGDMSFAAAKTIDIEVWLPGQNRYYEVSSVSNCTDFQARRSQIRFRQKNEKPQFVHTLNGSGLATSRLMVALLENNQQEDGSVLVPKVLHKYLEEENVCIQPK